MSVYNKLTVLIDSLERFIIHFLLSIYMIVLCLGIFYYYLRNRGRLILLIDLK